MWFESLKQNGAQTGGVLGSLVLQPADPLLGVLAAFRADPRADKLDLGVGVYRDAGGATPVMRAVKEAEMRLQAEQPTKAYLGSNGDVEFLELLTPIAFGDSVAHDRLSGVQTPGGTGALRLAAELIGVARPGGRIWVGAPTWANHLPILDAARLEIVSHPYFDVASQTMRFDALIEALEGADAGDAVLIHGCCHNPTGADLSPEQWRAVARVVAERGLLPLVDLAYQGLGDGLDADAEGMRILLGTVGEALIAYSCDKNFGMYRERTGALFALSPTPQAAGIALSNLLSLARANWSMPPDHGAAVVRMVLADPALRADWQAELDGMRDRLNAMRRMFAAELPELGVVAMQKGLFSTLPLRVEEVRRLRDEFGIYMTDSGRINIAGFTEPTVAPFARAVKTVLADR